MELRHLRYFVAVAEAGNVSRAAAQLRISQPAISRQIRDLEAELGVALFERTGRNLHLTGAGEDLLAYGRKVLNEAAAFRERARVLQGGDTGVLHVGSTPMILQGLFPPVLERFRRILPGVDVRLREGHPVNLVELLRKGELDLAYMMYQPELDAASRTVGGGLLLAVSSGRGQSQRAETIELRELGDVPLLLLQRGFASRDLFDAACQMAHIRVNIFLEGSAPAVLLSLVKAQCGVAVLPSTAALEKDAFTVQRVVQDGKPLELRLAIHWNPQRLLPPYAERFIEELSAHARKELSGAAVLSKAGKAHGRRRGK